MLYRITVKNSKLTNGIRVEKGMSVDVVSNKIKELSTIEDEIEEMDDLLETYEPIVKKMLPTVQNTLVETLPSETFDEMEADKGLEGLVKFITT